MISDRESLNLAGAFVGVGLICILGFVTWALVFREVPKGNENAFTLLIGILSANVGLVVGFFFGSSVTSKKQTETIDTLARTAATQTSDPTSIVLAPGQQATATATDSGTVIQPQSGGTP